MEKKRPVEKSRLPQKSGFFFFNFLLNRNFAVCKIWALDPPVRAECFPHFCPQFKSNKTSFKRPTGVTKNNKQQQQEQQKKPKNINFNKKVKNKTTLK